MPAFLIMTQCDNGAAYAECDQIVHDALTARREAADLRKMGCGPIRVYEFADGNAAQDYVDEKNAHWPSKSVATQFGLIR